MVRDGRDQVSIHIEFANESMTLARYIVFSAFERVSNEDRISDRLNSKRAVVGRNARVFEAAGTVEFGERPVERVYGAPGEISRVERVVMYRKTLVDGVGLGVLDHRVRWI